MKLILIFFLLFSNTAIAQNASQVVAEIKFNKSKTSKINLKEVEKSARKELGAEFESFDEKEKSLLIREMLERMIERNLLLNQAIKNNLLPSKNSVEKFITAIDKKLENASSVNKELSKHGIKEGNFKTKLRQELAIKQFLDKKVFNNISISKLELEKEMSSFKHKTPSQHCLQLLYIDKNQDIVKIKKLAEQDFEATARKFSFGKKGAEKNCYTKNQLPREVLKVLPTLEKDVVSPSIVSKDFFYLVKLQKIIESKIKSLSKDQAEKRVLRKKRQKELDLYLKELKDKTSIIRYLN